MITITDTNVTQSIFMHAVYFYFRKVNFKRITAKILETSVIIFKLFLILLSVFLHRQLQSAYQHLHSSAEVQPPGRRVSLSDHLPVMKCSAALSDRSQGAPSWLAALFPLLQVATRTA